MFSVARPYAQTFSPYSPLDSAYGAYPAFDYEDAYAPHLHSEHLAYPQLGALGRQRDELIRQRARTAAMRAYQRREYERQLALQLAREEEEEKAYLYHVAQQEALARRRYAEQVRLHRIRQLQQEEEQRRREIEHARRAEQHKAAQMQSFVSLFYVNMLCCILIPSVQIHALLAASLANDANEPKAAPTPTVLPTLTPVVAAAASPVASPAPASESTPASPSPDAVLHQPKAILPQPMTKTTLADLLLERAAAENDNEVLVTLNSLLQAIQQSPSASTLSTSTPAPKQTPPSPTTAPAPVVAHTESPATEVPVVSPATTSATSTSASSSSPTPTSTPTPPTAHTTAFDALDRINSTLHTLTSSFTLPRIDFSSPASSSSDSRPSSPTTRIPYTPANQPVHAYEAALGKLLDELDAVESDGNDEVRLRRKELVRNVEKKLAELDEAVEAQRREWRAAAVPVSEVNAEVLGSAPVDAPSQEDVVSVADKMESQTEVEPSLTAVEQQSTSAVANADTDMIDVNVHDSAEELHPVVQNITDAESSSEAVAAPDSTISSLPPHESAFEHEHNLEEVTVQLQQSPESAIQSVEDNIPPSLDTGLPAPEGEAGAVHASNTNSVVDAPNLNEIPLVNQYPVAVDLKTVDGIYSQSQQHSDSNSVSDLASDSSSNLGEFVDVDGTAHDDPATMVVDHGAPCVDPKVVRESGWLDVEIEFPLPDALS
jgi:hypothetical protein